MIKKEKNGKTKEKKYNILYCQSSTKGKVVREAYKVYREWYNLVKTKGLKTIKKEKIYPLSIKNDILWFK